MADWAASAARSIPDMQTSNPISNMGRILIGIIIDLPEKRYCLSEAKASENIPEPRAVNKEFAPAAMTVFPQLRPTQGCISEKCG
jgi:hypothetical protein